MHSKVQSMHLSGLVWKVKRQSTTHAEMILFFFVSLSLLFDSRHLVFLFSFQFWKSYGGHSILTQALISLPFFTIFFMNKAIIFPPLFFTQRSLSFVFLFDFCFNFISSQILHYHHHHRSRFLWYSLAALMNKCFSVLWEKNAHCVLWIVNITILCILYLVFNFVLYQSKMHFLFFLLSWFDLWNAILDFRLTRKICYWYIVRCCSLLHDMYTTKCHAIRRPNIVFSHCGPGNWSIF